MIRTQYLKTQKYWSAYTTIKGFDIYELDNTRSGAISKLKTRIQNSNYFSN